MRGGRAGTVSGEAIDHFIEEASSRALLGDGGLAADRLREVQTVRASVHPRSFVQRDGVAAFLADLDDRPFCVVAARGRLPAGFRGAKRKAGRWTLLFCPLSHGNASALRRYFPHTAPKAVSRERTTFGVGDRLGVAGPALVRLFEEHAAVPVLAQQSLREVTLMGRSFEEVLDSSTWSVFREGFTKPWGADGDHLKTAEWVKKVLRIGYTMVTADVSDLIEGRFAACSEAEVFAAYERLRPEYRNEVEARYLGARFRLADGSAVAFTREELARNALVYSGALGHALTLYNAARKAKPSAEFDFELSVDETDAPTTAQAHVFIAKEARRLGIRLSSLAPRFVGEFQKGIDYIGDIDAFARHFKEHARIADACGHKVSVHSGSDKFAIFPIIGVESAGRFHIKTSGTNWLSALLTVARLEQAFFRTLYTRAVNGFERARALYRVTTDIGNVPDIETIEDSRLPALFENPDVRQVLHITYGELCADEELKARLFACLSKQAAPYWAELETHIGRHFASLGIRKNTAR